MASICNDDWASLGVMSGHERKTLTLSDRTLNRSAARRFTPPSFDERAGRPGVTLP